MSADDLITHRMERALRLAATDPVAGLVAASEAYNVVADREGWPTLDIPSDLTDDEELRLFMAGEEDFDG